MNEFIYTKQILIDDAGWGDLLLGVIIGALKLPEHRYMERRIPVSSFQPPHFANKEAPLIIGDTDATPNCLLIDGNQIEQMSASDRLNLNYNSPNDVSMVVGGGDVGVGTTSPAAKLDVNSDSDALRLRAGNGWTEEARNQILFSYDGGTQYAHAIKTRHKVGEADNAIEFYVWSDALDDPGDVGTRHVMTLEGGSDSPRVGIATQEPARALHVNDVMRLEPRSSAPSSPGEGDMYINSTTDKLMVYVGGAWHACW